MIQLNRNFIYLAAHASPPPHTGYIAVNVGAQAGKVLITVRGDSAHGAAYMTQQMSLSVEDARQLFTDALAGLSKVTS